MNEKFLYRAYGIEISSELALPEFPASDARHPNSLHIELASPEAAESDTNDYLFSRRDDGSFAMFVPDAGTFIVASEMRIRIVPLPTADTALLRLFTVGSAMGMVLHLRGLLVLHASAVLLDGKATLFVGDSGSGKSTIAAQFAKAGHPVLADDVMPIFIHATGHAFVRPGSVSFKLWRDSLDSLGIETGDLEGIANRIDKFYVPNPRPAPEAAYPIDAIIQLETAPATRTHARGIERLAILESLRVLAENTYRPEYITLLGRQEQHFSQCATLATQVPVLRLRRFSNGDGQFASLIDQVMHIETDR